MTAPADDARAPLHRRILAAIEEPIIAGDWRPGTRIPAETELARRFACARMTVNKALSELARKGLIERRKRGGSFVASPRGQSAVLEISDIRAEVEAQGAAYRYELLARRKGRASAAERLAFGFAGGLVRVEARHFAGASPFCLEQRAISLAVAPAAETEAFDLVSPGAWLLQQIPWSEAEHRISAIGADARAAERLGLTPGAPCLLVERRTWADGRPVTAARLTYPAERHVLVARFSPDRG